MPTEMYCHEDIKNHRCIRQLHAIADVQALQARERPVASVSAVVRGPRLVTQLGFRRAQEHTRIGGRRQRWGCPRRRPPVGSRSPRQCGARGRGGGEGWPPLCRGPATAPLPCPRPHRERWGERERERKSRDCRDSPARGMEGEGAAGAPPEGAPSDPPR